MMIDLKKLCEVNGLNFDVCNVANVLGISVDNDICASKMKRWVERKKGE